ncbi:MAG: bifunctional transaldolase/phosoglucose isomerase [Burkholderiales bacterium]|nr:bifunctional transaldolase/phosoglucose isomerase [Anaerolineae bacterium]
MAENPTVEVQQYGQSLWLDYIHRKSIDSGELQAYIDDYGILGVTSNPSIFQKAIGESDSYDEAMKTLLELDPYDIYERLAVRDIQDALDLFRPIYDRTSGRDGYVSLEVSPLIANDTATTIAEARRLFEVVDRPNVMIKIPSTPEGIPAIEEVIASGVSVNVTLIFALKNYQEVAEAYVRGLERRLAAGGDVSKIASVASFFLSRIDVMIDRMLENNIRAAQGRDLDRVTSNRNLLGKAAIANAKVAYKHFMRVFNGERFKALREAGAMPQRVLWASTGTKNPAYPDTMYLDELIGKDTVNTVPPATLKAFKDHGTAAETLPKNIGDAERMLDMLAEVGIDIDDITHQLQLDGVALFVESFESLLSQVDAKRNVLRSGLMARQNLALSIYAEQVHEAIAKLEKEFANQRIWAHEGSLWKDNAAVITKVENRLGWLDVLTTIDRARLQGLQDSVRGGIFKHVVLLGMGGSSLAPEVLSLTFGKQDGFPDLHMLDTTDPVRIKEVTDAIDPASSLFIVSSKSGGTVETSSLYQHFWKITGEKGAQFIAITDPDSDLEKLARDKGFRDLYLNPADIGGRYSALSYFGMVPAALIGLDLNALWASAEEMAQGCGANVPASSHPGLQLGALLGTLGLQGRDKICIYCSPSISSFGNWIEQLIAESTGKEGVGLLPVVGATVGKPHDYSSDRQIIYLRVDGDDNDEIDAGIKMLREAGHPRVTLYLPDKFAIAGEFFRWEYATAIAGKILNINPFDEPNVAEAKEATSRLLKLYIEEGALPASEPALTGDGLSLYANEQFLNPLYELCQHHGYDSATLTGLLAAQVNSTRAGDYFALLAYLPPTAEINEALEDIRRRLRHVTKRAITLGYGPRYLHSTGQLHKGGPNNGVFFEFTYDNPFDLDIPGSPYSFGTLKNAQALGDLETLQAHGRRALRLHVHGGPDRVVSALQAVHAALDLAESRRQ